MLNEHARNVLAIGDATHRESSDGGTAIVTPLSCSLAGRTIDVALTPGKRLSALHRGAARLIAGPTQKAALRSWPAIDPPSATNSTPVQ